MGKKNVFEVETESPKKVLSEREKSWLDEEVEIEFYNMEEPGMTNKFPYGTTKNFKVYTLFHGGRYKLPRKVVQHIESRQTPMWKWQPDGSGQMTKKMIGMKPRFQCRQVFA
jgi:hypothetical protein